MGNHGQSTQCRVIEIGLYMNIYPPSYHGLPVEVCWKRSKSPPWMALLFLRIQNYLFVFWKNLFQSSICLLSNRTMHQVKEVKAVRCVVLQTNCIFARLDLYWSQKHEMWLILTNLKKKIISACGSSTQSRVKKYCNAINLLFTRKNSNRC